MYCSDDDIGNEMEEAIERSILSLYEYKYSKKKAQKALSKAKLRVKELKKLINKALEEKNRENFKKYAEEYNHLKAEFILLMISKNAR